MESEFLQIKRFVEDYKHFNHTVAKARIAHDKARFGGLLTGYRTIKSVSDSYERKLTTDYNVFSILKNAWKDETRTHSPFLKDLLDVNGSHRQGHLFYMEFLKQLRLPSVDKYVPTNLALFDIRLEKWCGNGSIDIFISYHDNKKRFAIAIENKIFAGDQDKQLERYYNYLQSHYKEDFLLVYLTRNGVQPWEETINGMPLQQFHDKDTFRTMSYRENLVVMLQETNKVVQSDKVKFIIDQYLLTLKMFS